MSLRFDDDARHEYLEAIRFYRRAAERFVQAVDVAIEQIRGDPERFREVEPGVRSCRVPKFQYSILYGLSSAFTVGRVLSTLPALVLLASRSAILAQ